MQRRRRANDDSEAYYRYGGRHNNNSDRKNNRHHPPFRHHGGWKRQVLSMLAALGTLGILYLTPVSEWIMDLLLDFVPLSSDWELGWQTVQEGFAANERYDKRWSPILQSVQTDLAQTLQRILVKRRKEHGTHYNDVPCLHHYYNDEGGGAVGDKLFFRWDVKVIHERQINALALPGGFIRVTDQLLHQLQPTRGEVAALLAHEMGHVLCRHSQARILQNQLVHFLYKTLFENENNNNGSRHRGQGNYYNHHPQGQHAFSFTNLLFESASFFGQQSFSRRDEYQADAVSWALLQDSSNAYTPESLHSLLVKLWSLQQQHAAAAAANANANEEEKDKNIASTIVAWSRTHPTTQDRLAALEEKWQGLSTRERERLSQNAI